MCPLRLGCHVGRWPRFEKAPCLEALVAEYNRLGRPLSKLRYNGAQARDHVHRLMSRDLASAAVPAAPAGALDEGVPDDGEAPAEEEDGGEDEEQVPLVWTSFQGDGQWLIFMSDPDGGPDRFAPLPSLSSNGDGYWSVVDIDGELMAFQGGSTDPIPVYTLISTSSSALAGQSSEPSLLPGMRLPADDDDEDASYDSMRVCVCVCVCVCVQLRACSV